MSIHRLVMTITLYNLEQVAALATSLALLEDAPIAEVMYIRDTDTYSVCLYAD